MKNIAAFHNMGLLLIVLLIPFSLASQTTLEKQYQPGEKSKITGRSIELCIEGQPGGSRTDSTWIHYDDVENFESWGFLTNGEIYDVMSKWDPDDLTNYGGWEITKIKFIVVNALPVLQVKVWEGPDATEIYSQDVPVFNVNGWTVVELDSAVVFDNTQELYFGYNVDMSQVLNGGFVTATDDGPPVDGYGNLVRKDGQWLSEYNNHNLRALIAESLSAEFLASKTTVCDSNEVIFSNLSTGAESYQWVFQGGTPFISTLENPTVTYNTPGTYNVTLTATSGGNSITEVKEDYITVLEIPGQIAGEELVCEWTEGTYSVEENEGSTYTWEATNGEVVSGQGTHTAQVLWHDPGAGYLSLHEETVHGCGGIGSLEVTIDECTGVEEHEARNRLSIMPNPVTGSEFVLNTESSDKVYIEILNLHGVLLHSGYLQPGSTKVHSLNLAGGLYFARATFANGQVKLLKFMKQ